MIIFDEYIRNTAETLSPVGTCKMGMDEMAVTNEYGQARKVNGLRVDAHSCFPYWGNTDVSTMMIAEKFLINTCNQLRINR